MLPLMNFLWPACIFVLLSFAMTISITGQVSVVNFFSSVCHQVVQPEFYICKSIKQVFYVQ